MGKHACDFMLGEEMYHSRGELHWTGSNRDLILVYRVNCQGDQSPAINDSTRREAFLPTIIAQQSY